LKITQPRALPAIVFLLIAACTAGPSRSSFPKKPITIMAPANPGGGWDQTARVIQQVLTREKILPVPSEVINRQGAGGTIGLAELVARGDPHTMMVMGRVMLGSIITNHSAVSLKDTVPIALLLDEYEIIAVPVDSKYKTLRDLLEDFKRQPERISWGGGSAGGTDHILVAMIAKAIGVDPAKINYIAYSGGGEAAVSVMGGNITAGVSGYGEWKPYVDSGKLRYLAVSSDRRVAADSPPTIRESGVDVAMSNWRAVVGPRGIDDETRSWLTQAMSRMRSSAAWQEVLRKNDWTDHFVTGPELDRFIETETASNTEMLASIGLTGDDQAIADYAAVGPWTIPAVIAIGLLLSTVGAVREAQARKREASRNRPPLQSIDWKTAAIFGVLLITYAVLLNPIGYLLTTCALLITVPRLLGSQRFIRDLVFSVVTSITVYAFFNFVLRIGLPPGLLG
jgi:putative tricarboxylic transport membrane protein